MPTYRVYFNTLKGDFFKGVLLRASLRVFDCLSKEVISFKLCQ
jgi:hypothetical protein